MTTLRNQRSLTADGKQRLERAQGVLPGASSGNMYGSIVIREGRDSAASALWPKRAAGLRLIDYNLLTACFGVPPLMTATRSCTAA